MKYALEPIETLIQSDLDPDKIKLKQLSIEILSKYIITITEEKSLVRSILIEEVFSLKKEKSAELLIQHYQSALINLADDVMQSMRAVEVFHLPFTEAELSIITVYRHMLKSLEDLLTFIEKHFNRYFNIDERIPESYKLLMQSKFRTRLKLLIKRYKVTNIDNDLFELMMDPFRKFINAGSLKQVTYRELLYLKMLHKELAEMLLPHQKILAQQNMIDLMVYLNYNNYFFINYYINIILKDVNESDSISQQIQQLAWWIKTISQVQTRPVVAYKIKDPSAREQLISWLIDETAFLEKKHQLTLVIPPHPIPLIKSPFRIFTSMSVKQVALLTRLLFDTGIIKSDNQTDMLTKIAAGLKTERKEMISAQNLRVKYYNIDEPTKSILKDWLFKMNDQLRKY